MSYHHRPPHFLHGHCIDRYEVRARIENRWSVGYQIGPSWKKVAINHHCCYRYYHLCHADYCMWAWSLPFQALKHLYEPIEAICLQDLGHHDGKPDDNARTDDYRQDNKNRLQHCYEHLDDGGHMMTVYPHDEQGGVYCIEPFP